ncbi:MAG: DHHA1 domain-containing protein, partial [Planctomycetota bacterium]|nr:DHHA1 domain-containing protein [Planctomycetota bacterium]
IALDSANLERIEGIAAVLRPDVPLVNIDHHGSNSRFGSINWVDPGSASVGEMIYDIILAAGGGIDHDIALGLYVSVMTDTGRFSFSNTSSRSHRIAAAMIEHGLKPAEIARRVYADKTLGEMRLNVECLATMKFSPDGRVAWARLTREMYRKTGTSPRDSQEYVEAVKSIHGVDIAILLRETEKPGHVKLSFRATDPLNAAEVAALFGGGGHPRSSGATLDGDADTVETRVVQAILQYVRERPNTGNNK